MGIRAARPVLGQEFRFQRESVDCYVGRFGALPRVGTGSRPSDLAVFGIHGDAHYDVALEVEIIPENGEGLTVCRSNFKHMYWNMRQQLAHHTVNGCNIHAGDMMASGTISGPEKGSFGSMLEISWRGTQPVQMPDGSERKFILNGDTVRMSGFALKPGAPRIGFGAVDGKVVG